MIMPYPKEKMAQQHEKDLISWLKINQKMLPLSLYALGKALGWSFGALRGTILRITNRHPAENPLVIKEVSNPSTKRYISYIALKGTQSETKLNNQVEYLNENTQIPQKSVNLPMEQILLYLEKLKQLDDKVLLLATEITDIKTIDKFLEYQFGLEEKDKKELNQLINTLKSTGGQ
jgi:hypothetical protein